MTRISKQPDIRRQELLDIGVSLYFKLGEKAVSIQQVVKQANVATGLFYYYFKSKDDFLDEALNYFVEKEFTNIEKVLITKNKTALEILNNVLDEYYNYALKMSPYRDNKVFKTDRHYELTERVIKKMLIPVSNLIQQGIEEESFHVLNADLTTNFILYGLTCIFDSTLEIESNHLVELKRIINKILERVQP